MDAAREAAENYLGSVYGEDIVILADRIVGKVYLLMDENVRRRGGELVDQGFLSNLVGTMHFSRVLADGLIAQWELGSDIVEYQAKYCCDDCTNLFVSRIQAQV